MTGVVLNVQVRCGGLRCEVPCEVSFVRWCPAGSVASMDGVPTRHVVGETSPCPVV